MTFPTKTFRSKLLELLDAQSHKPGLPQSGSFPVQILIAHPWGSFLNLQADYYLKIMAIRSATLFNSCLTKCYMSWNTDRSWWTTKPNFLLFYEHLWTAFSRLDWSQYAHRLPRKPHLTFRTVGKCTEMLMPFKVLNCGEWKSIRPAINCTCQSKPIQLTQFVLAILRRLHLKSYSLCSTGDISK